MFRLLTVHLTVPPIQVLRPSQKYFGARVGRFAPGTSMDDDLG